MLRCSMFLTTLLLFPAWAVAQMPSTIATPNSAASAYVTSGVPSTTPDLSSARSLREAIATVRIAPSPAVDPRPSLSLGLARQGSPERMGTPKRVFLTALLGTAGFFAGGYIGAAIDGDCGGCDDPGLVGALIGWPVGAATAAIVTWKLTGR